MGVYPVNIRNAACHQKMTDYYSESDRFVLINSHQKVMRELMTRKLRAPRFSFDLPHTYALDADHHHSFRPVLHTCRS